MDPALKLLLGFFAGALTLLLFYEWRWRRPPIDQLSLYKLQLTQLKNEVADLRVRLREAVVRYTEETRAHAVSRERAHEVQLRLTSGSAGARGTTTIDPEQVNLLEAQRLALADELEGACRRLEKTEAFLTETQSELADAQLEMAAMEVALAGIASEPAGTPAPGARHAAAEAAAGEHAKALAQLRAELNASQMELSQALAVSVPASVNDRGELEAERDRALALADDLRQELADVSALASQFPILEFEKEQLASTLAQSEAERKALAARASEATAYARKLQGKYDYVLARLRQFMDAKPSTESGTVAAAGEAVPADSVLGEHVPVVETSPLAPVPTNGGENVPDASVTSAEPLADDEKAASAGAETTDAETTDADVVLEVPPAAGPETEQTTVDPARFRLIHGIGPTFERRLHEAGVLSFSALASLSPERLQEITKARRSNGALLTDWLVAAKALAST